LPDITAVGATETAAAAIERLRAGYAARYGAAVFDVGLVVDHEDRLRLSGTVLMAGQRTEAIEAARAVLGPTVADDIVVLVEEDCGPWFAVAGVLDVFAGPDGELATQTVPGDARIRRLAERGAWWVVELADGTVGWCMPHDRLVRLSPDREPRSTAEWRSSFRGAWKEPALGWRDAVEAWLDTPYLWGGNTRAGVDCSGFVQRVVKESGGLGLPKHSVDQMRAGRRVAADQVVPGDLVYLTRRDDGVRHIALVIHSGPPVEVAHAGRGRGVAMEPLDNLIVSYQIRGACRLGPDPE
jgi:hypothetical protein